MRDVADLRRRMVEFQLRERGIRDERVLRAMGTVPRELFVPGADVERAYADEALSIGFDQTISQPYMVALICQEAGIHDGALVLDVGTGSGYQAAVLAAMGAQVESIERVPELADLASRNLANAGYGDRVTVHVGDGTLGLPGRGPFDAITVAAAAPEIPRTLYSQLAANGRMVVPVGTRRNQRLEVIVSTPEGPAVAKSVRCRFVPLIGAEGHS